jgi:hypothetical protein
MGNAQEGKGKKRKEQVLHTKTAKTDLFRRKMLEVEERKERRRRRGKRC